MIEGYGWTECTREEGQKKGGGLGVLYSNSCPIAEWEGLKQSTERQWVLWENKAEKIAFCNMYLACVTARREDYETDNVELLTILTEEIEYLRGITY